MKVLIVDDDAGLRKSVSLVLSDAGYEVVTATDGEEGLTTAQQERPDLILCDVRMPKVDGLEFLERHGRSGLDSLVLVMTAYGSLELAVRAMKPACVGLSGNLRCCRVRAAIQSRVTWFMPLISSCTFLPSRSRHS